MNNSNYIINLLLKENGLAGKIKTLQGSFDSLNTSVKGINNTIEAISSKFSKELEQIGNSAENAGDGLKKSLGDTEFVNLVTMAQNLSEGFKTLTGSASSFEQSMANLSATTGITGKDLDELNRIVRETGWNGCPGFPGGFREDEGEVWGRIERGLLFVLLVLLGIQLFQFIFDVIELLTIGITSFI